MDCWAGLGVLCGLLFGRGAVRADEITLSYMCSGVRLTSTKYCLIGNELRVSHSDYTDDKTFQVDASAVWKLVKETQLRSCSSSGRSQIVLNIILGSQQFHIACNRLEQLPWDLRQLFIAMQALVEPHLFQGN
jgi:hypothetical protein